MMNSTLASVVRQCGEKSIRSSRDGVERFAAGYTERIAALRKRLKISAVLVTKMKLKGDRSEIYALQATREVDVRIASVERFIKHNAQTLIDRLSRLPDLLVAMLQNVRANTVSSPLTQDVVCPKVEIVIRPELATVSWYLSNAKSHADHHLQETEQMIAKLETFVALLRREM